MAMLPSFITADFVAREVNYAMEPFEWGKADRATVDAFHGPQWAAKWNQMADEIVTMGFKAIDIWVAHLNPTRVNGAMVSELADILKKHDLKVVAYTGGLGKPNMTIAEGKQVYDVAKGIGTPLIDVGLNLTNAKLAYDLGKEYGIKYAMENHPEKNPQEILAKIGNYGEIIGVAQDTGFWGMFDYDAVKATYELKDHLMHMHLKQMHNTFWGWHSCAFDDGVVNIPGVIDALKKIGYDGAVSVEHEPHAWDPTFEVARSLKLLNKWLAE